MSRKILLMLAVAMIASIVLITPTTADRPVVTKPPAPDTPEIEHGMGAIFTPPEIMKTFPRLPLDTAKVVGAAQLPTVVDHSAGLPPVGDQGPKGTCVAWGTTYYYRTYQEGVEHGWDLSLPDGSADPDHVFSPAWTFSIGGNLDDDCSGMMTSAAFSIFEERGATTLSVMPNVYSPWYQPTALQEGAAFPYRALAFDLTGYPAYVYQRWLSGYYSPYGWTPPEGDIFSIAVNVPDGFHDPIGTCPNMWVDPAAIATQSSGGGHVIAVIGYSDTITFTGGISPTAVYTGGFQIINSWGADYGCDGKVWFPYDAWDATLGDGSYFVREQWGMINLANYSISGQVTDGGVGLEGVEVRLNNNPYLATTTDADGNYTLTPGYGDYTITVKPLMEGYTFDPVVASLEAVEADTTGVDFVAMTAAPDLASSTKTVDHPVLPNTTPPEFTVSVESTGAGTSFSLEDPIPADTTYVANSAQAAWGTVHAEGDLMAWEALPSTLNTERYGLSAEVGQDSGGTYYVYAIGGHDTTTDQTLDTVERAAINPDGSLGAWEVMSDTLNTPRAFFDTAVLDIGGTDYIYVVGGGQGYTATLESVPGLHTDLDTVERAPVNADGTVGPWETLAATLVVTRSELSVVSDGNYMWAIGGTNWDPDIYPDRHGGDNPLQSVEYAAVNPDGTLGAWTTTTDLRETRNTADAVIVSDGTISYIELVGGRTGGNVDRAYGERAAINPDGTLGSWSISERLHWGRYGPKVVAVDDYLYAVGGRDHGGPLGEVERTKVDADGTLFGWQLSPGMMTTPRSDFGLVAHDGRIYAIGGRVSELYCVCYYDVGSGCGYAIDSVEVAEPVEPGTVWWDGELGEADGLALTLSVMPQVNGTLLPPGSIFVNTAEIEDSEATVTSVSQSVEIMDVDMARAEKVAYPDKVKVGETLAFTITLPNDGGWSEVSVADALPAGLEYVYGSAQTSSGVVGTPGEVWEWTESDYGPLYNRVYFDLVAPGNGFVYAVGPWYDTEYAPINPDGSLGDWQFATDMSTDRMGVSAVAPGNGYIYAVGGGPDGTDSLATTERAEILPDGSLGEWEVLESTLVYPRSWHNVVAPGNGYLYALSGYEAHQTTSYTSTEYCEIYPDGTLGPWQELEATVNHTRDMAGAVAYNGYIYIAGGEDWNLGSDATIEYAQINEDGTLGDFVVSPNEMNNVRDTFGFVESDGILYAIGGRQWGTVDGPDQDTVESSEILPDGSVGPWTVNHGRLPVGLGFASAEASDGFIYVVDHWSAYYTEILDSLMWEGEVDYQGEVVLTFEAELVDVAETGTMINTATIEYNMGTLDRSASFMAVVEHKVYLPLLFKSYNPIPITVLHTNDEHGWLQPFVAYGSPVTEGGAASLMGRFTQIEGYSPDADGFLLLSAGDNWTGPSISTWFEGEPVVEVMNAMGYDVSVIGNHEFDFGREALNERIAEADFPFLSANIYYTGTTTLADFVTPYVIEEVSGVKVGIVGLTTTETPVTTHPKNITDLCFGDYEEALRREVPKMRAKGAELIIVESHVCSENLVPLAEAVSDLDIALMEGGHCHDTFMGQVGDTLIVETHWAMRAYGKTVLYVDAVTHDVVDSTQQIIFNQYVTEEGNPVTPDPEVQAIVDYWQAETDEAMGEVIGYTEDGIARQSWEQANYVTDSWLWAYPEGDFAMTNWGGFRADIAAGDITVGDIVGVLPFDNVIVDCAITGAQLVENLEACHAAVGGFAYTYHEDDGQTVVDSVTLLADGSPLDMAATYHVLVNDFMYLGGDGYLFYQQDPNAYDTSIQWRQPVIDWTEAQNTSATNPIDALIDDQPRAEEVTP